MEELKKKNRTMSLVMAVLLSAVMGVAATFLVLKNNPQAAASTPVPVLYGSNICLSILVGLIVAFVVPLGKLGGLLARKADAHPPGLRFTLLNALPLSVGNTVIISLVLSFVGVFSARAHAPAEAVAQMPPLPVMWLGSWAQMLIPTLIASYVTAVLLSPIAAAIVGLNRKGDT